MFQMIRRASIKALVNTTTSSSRCQAVEVVNSSKSSLLKPTMFNRNLESSITTTLLSRIQVTNLVVSKIT